MVDSAVVVAVITSLFGLLGAMIGGYSLYKQVTKKAETDIQLSANTTAIEAARTEAIAKAEVVKSSTEAKSTELKSMIELVVDQVKELRDENKDQRAEMNAIRKDSDDTRLRLDACLEEKSKMQSQLADMEIARREDKAMMTEIRNQLEKHRALYEAATAQISGTVAYKKGQVPDRRKETVKIENATIKGEKK